MEGDSLVQRRKNRYTISIHALHTEGDGADAYDCVITLEFQSTPSTRRATRKGGIYRLWNHISIHALHTEGDAKHSAWHSISNTFQSTPSTRRATIDALDQVGTIKFQSTPSTRRATIKGSKITQ